MSGNVPGPDLEQAGQAVLAATTAVARELHAGRTAPAAITLDSDLDRDVGLDSLSRVELGARLEARTRDAVGGFDRLVAVGHARERDRLR